MSKVTAVQPNDFAYLRAAFSKLGLSEIAGPRDEPQIIAMYAACGHPEAKHDEIAWCAAFVGWSLHEGGLANTGSLLAISYAHYGAPLDKHKPIPRGAIAVWHREGGNHVNFVLADNGTTVTCIGGNQSNGRGGGVTISDRRKDEAVAYRMPPGVAQPAPKPMPAPSIPQDTEQPDPQAALAPAPPQPDDSGPDEPAPVSPKSGITEGAKAGIGATILGVLTQVWDGITQAPDTILQAIVAIAQKPAFWVFVIAGAAAFYVYWRRREMKKAG